MIMNTICVQPSRPVHSLDQGMAGAAAQLRQLVSDHPTSEHAQMLSTIAALIDALLLDGATRH